MKNLVVTAGIVFGVVALIVLVVLNRNDDGEPVSLPDSNEVDKITAKLFDLEGFGIHAVPEFEVPREHFGTLLGAISPAEKSSEGRRFVKRFGELTITTKTASEQPSNAW